LASKRWALARATPWWMLAFPSLAVALDVSALGDVLAAVVAFVREPAMTSDGASTSIAFVVAAMLVVIAARWWRRPEGRVVLALMAGGAVAHALGHAPMPLVGYGGSAIVAVCLAFGFAVRTGRGWTSEARVG